MLTRLETETDIQPAKALAIKRASVRYCVRRLFAKLQVHSRLAAARRARLPGILPDEDR